MASLWVHWGHSSPWAQAGSGGEMARELHESVAPETQLPSPHTTPACGSGGRGVWI